MNRKYLITFLSSAKTPSAECYRVCNDLEQLRALLNGLENNSYVYNITIKLIYE